MLFYRRIHTYIMKHVSVQKYLNVLTTFKKSRECYVSPNQNSFVYTDSYMTYILLLWSLCYRSLFVLLSIILSRINVLNKMTDTL
jgi:hypothetical protein